MSYGGGTSSQGTIFQYDYINNIYTKKVDLSNAAAAYAFGDLIETSPGILHGVTPFGGTNLQGALFEYNFVSNSLSVKHNFVNATGVVPYGSLYKASNNKLYGLTNGGGINSNGVVFEFNIATNTYSVIHHLAYIDGTQAHSTFMEANNGKLYAPINGGGTNYQGTILEYDFNINTLTKKIDLGGAADGATPQGSLTQASFDKLLGMTNRGGVNDEGTIFEYTYSTNTYTKKIDLSTAIGNYPSGALLKASNGLFYGLTSQGGTNNVGVLFEYNYASNIYTKIIDFSSSIGSSPRGGLIQANNGKLYGVTYSGGANGRGVLFEYDITTNIYSVLHHFVSITEGQFSYGGLMQATNGKLYGSNTGGGANGDGVLYEFDITTNTITPKVNFDFYVTGGSFSGSMVEADSGKLYGTQVSGASQNTGLIFEYNFNSNVYTIKKEFPLDSTNILSLPTGTLVKSKNGKLYGMTQDGWWPSYYGFFGGIFEYDILLDTLISKINFNVENGKSPNINSLIEISLQEIKTENILSYTFCAGSSLSVPYTKQGIFMPGNTFTAQLSDSLGSFASPVNIGSIASLNNGSIAATIPNNTPSGSNYKIRVVSNLPVTNGSVLDSNITINPITTTTTNISACNSYVWPVNGNTYNASGSYTYASGCSIEVLNLTITIGHLVLATSGNTSSLVGTNSITNILANNAIQFSLACDDAATLSDDPSGVGAGLTTLTTTVEANNLVGPNGQVYAPRHAEISATNNESGSITLFATQDDFDDYNANNGSLLDMDLSTVKMVQVIGNLNSGTITAIPSSAIFNAGLNRYEISASTPNINGGYYLYTNPSCALNMSTISSGSITPNSAMLSWTAVLGAINYEIRFRVVGSLVWSHTTTAGLSKGINGCLPATTYEYQGKVRCSVSASGLWGALGTFTTAPSLCQPPTGLTASSVASTTAMITWNASLNATSYVLQFRPIANPVNAWLGVGGNFGTSRFLQLLLSDTLYEIRIASWCASSGTLSAWSAPIQFATLPNPCTIPSNIQINTTSTTANIVWDIAPYATSYILRYKPTDSIGSWFNAGCAINHRVLTNLTPNTSYDVEIRSVCWATATMSDWSTRQLFTTSILRPNPTPAGLTEPTAAFNIYPNPTSEIVYVELYATEVQTTTVKVYDLTGRLMKQVVSKTAAGAQKIEVSLGDIASGMYTVQVYENNKLTHISRVRKN